jgi:signal transduction histidine kinase/CheY-like chemotaxis protein
MLDLWGSASDDEILARGADVHERLKRMVADLPQVQGLFLNSAGARPLATSLVFPAPRDIDYSDREWYQAHRGGDVGVHFSEQLRSRVSGEPFFDMSRRRVRSDGSFGGTVHVSLKPSYLTDFYAELARTEPGLRFAVLRADSKLIARYPAREEARPVDEALLATLREANDVAIQRVRSSSDGADRLRVLRQLRPYPLWVVSTIDVADVRAAWLHQLGWLALFAVPATLMLAWLARLALARTREELDAAQRFDEERARRQRAVVALLQAQKLEALGRLTGGVAHDFNNLLTVVANNLYLLRHVRPDLRASTHLAAIDRAVSTGTKLTRQLSSFSRRQALVPERFDLRERLPALIDLLGPVLGKGIEIVTHIADDVAMIEVDAAELELALLNLALNAKDAMPGGGRVEVVARNAQGGDPHVPGERFVLLEVADTGAGIPAHIAERVFEPFFTTKPIGKGTGLGLSQVQALCQRAGGTARIAVGPRGGTRVLLYFPSLDRTAEAPAAVPEAAAVARHPGCRVLLVEDNDAVASASRDVLASMGCTVDRVASGEAALECLATRSGEFDVVLSDIEMPGALDGIALAERVAARHAQLPVVLMTGYAARMEEAMHRRVDVLPKPVPPQLLSEAIANAMAARAGAPSGR